MDTSERDEPEVQKVSGKSNLPSLDSDWEILGPNLTDASVDLVPTNNHMLIPSSSCSFDPVVDSFGQTFSGHPCSVVNSRLVSVSIASSSNSVAWDPHPCSMPKEAFLMPNTLGVLPRSIPQFSTDSGFIERAARFSCFGADHFGAIMNNSFDSIEYLHQRGKGMMRGHQDVSRANDLRSDCGQSHKNGVLDCKEDEAHPIENVTDSEREATQSLLRRGNRSDDAMFSNIKGQEEWSCLEGELVEASEMCLTAQKRKRDGKDTKSNMLKEEKECRPNKTDNKAEEKQNGESSPGSAADGASGKYGKPGSQASDPSKGEYIHVRARGQATNSHSLAERLRREKISERMKLLQDLVPGCNKVTGKAVMLDEIINYVQSLQRQVEFLSMKLATVTSRLDLDIELLAKESLHQRPGSSSSLGFPQHSPMAYPPSPHSQQALTPLVHSYLNPSGILRRNTVSELSSLTAATNRGFKDQLVGTWNNELHDVVHMSYNAGSETQETTATGEPSPSQMKFSL